MRVCLHIFVLVLLAGVSFSQSRKENTGAISRLRFLSEFVVPYNYQYQNTTVGGLSGIDYNPKADEYYIISDDRSAINPVRFYTTKIALKGMEFDTVYFTGKTELLQPNGEVYPGIKIDPARAPDPEAIRFNAITGKLVWTSEGERAENNGNLVLQNPAINIADMNGRFVGAFPLPELFTMKTADKGPRHNGVFEGICFAGKRFMYVAMESPLFEDGPAAGLRDTTAYVRIMKYDFLKKRLLAQYAYKLEPVAFEPAPAGSFMVNGIVDILDIGNNEFLITERSYSNGGVGCVIKVFKCSFKSDTDINGVASLINNPPAKLVEKKLLLDMSEVSRYIDNVEGATYGPRLPNGHESIIFVSDNDFLPDRKTQFLLFEVIP